MRTTSNPRRLKKIETATWLLERTLEGVRMACQHFAKSWGASRNAV